MNTRQKSIINKTTTIIFLILSIALLSLTGAMILSLNKFKDILNYGFSWIFILFLIDVILWIVFRIIDFKKSVFKDFWFYLILISLVLIFITNTASLSTISNHYNDIISVQNYSNVSVSCSIWFLLISNCYSLFIFIWCFFDSFKLVKSFNLIIKELHEKNKNKQQLMNIENNLNIKINEQWNSINKDDLKQKESQTLVATSSTYIDNGKELILLLSITLDELTKIISNYKNVLFFKSLPNYSFSRIVLYVTNDNLEIGSIYGEFEISQTQTLSKSDAWSIYHNNTILDKDTYDLYFNNCTSIICLTINNIFPYLKPKNITEYGLDKGPLGYCYLQEN